MMNWLEFDKEVRELGTKIDWKPDAVVGVARGGVIPAAMLGRVLGVKDMFTIKVRRNGEKREIVETMPDMNGQKVLLVEDMLETGKSMIVTKEYLESKGAEVKTACLYTMPQTEIVPDFSLRQVQEAQHFPWE